MIKCPNPECQATNPEGRQQCSSCQAFLHHRYLWAVGNAAVEQLGQRYNWKHQKIVLDTEPGVPPPSPDPVPAYVWPYLMLASHGLHVPQPYALLNHGTGNEVLLLDMAAIAMGPKDTTPKLLPSLTDAWPTASHLRQLNWLWQIAGLWSDFTEQQVAGSLLDRNLLRVHGSLVRLLELTPDSQSLTLSHLGTFWQPLIPKAHPSIRDFLESLCHQLIQETIATSDVLVRCLDQAIATAAAGYRADYRLSVLTDQGPSRKRNEDACYPTSGKTQTHQSGPNTKTSPPLLLLVCDGIGGHDGGDIASQLAIKTIQQQLAPLLIEMVTQPNHDPIAITQAIEQAICVANDNISEHNDRGQRHARDRMGTTLVLALVIGVHIYVANVGDSRAYRISTSSCRQITFDDDVAAREVRLGYGFYADVVNRPGTGALIQALGMGHSAALHVAVQRLILDEDIALLLCSDGLSDYDRVEQCWPTHLLPLLTKKGKISTAATNLVQLANTYNGHDNVTVGVVVGHVQALDSPTVPKPSPQQPVAQLFANAKDARATQLPIIPPATPSGTPAKQQRSLWPAFLGLLTLLGTATALTMVFFRDGSLNSSPEAAPPSLEAVQDSIEPKAQPETQVVGINDSELTNPLLAPKSYLQLNQSVSLLATPQADGDDENLLGQLAAGTIVQVLTRQEPAAGQSRWVKLTVCASGSQRQLGDNPDNANNVNSRGINERELDLGVTTSELTTLTSGLEGWVLASKLAQTARTTEPVNCLPD